MKWLLILVLVLGAVWWLRRERPRNTQTDRPKPTQPPTASPAMVDCAVCGVHLPFTEAVQEGAHRYCCTEHRQLGSKGPR